MLVNKVLAGLLVLLVVAFSGCVSSSAESNSTQNQSGNNDNGAHMAASICPKISDPDLNNYCFAVAGKNETYCAKLQDSAKKDLCYGYLMKALEDESFCEKMENDKNKDYCYAQIGSIKESAEICEKISGNSLDYKDICYASAANATRNAGLCDKASSTESKEKCLLFLAGAWNDSSLCDKLTDKGRKYECLIATSSCWKLSEPAEVTWCLAYVEVQKYTLERCENLAASSGFSAGNACYWSEALNSNRPELCLKISSNEQSQACLAITQNNISLCCNSRGICSTYCYRGFASNKNNDSACAFVNNSMDKIWCLATAQKKPELCDIYQNLYKFDSALPWSESKTLDDFCAGESVGNYTNLCYCRTSGKNAPECYNNFWMAHNECYKEIAVSKKDPRLCDNLVEWAQPAVNGTKEYNSTNQLDCKSSVVSTADDVSVCNSAEFAGVKESCLYWVALHKSQASICGELATEKNKDNCYAMLSSKLADAALCDKIVNLETKDNCFAAIATKLGNFTYCEKVISIASRDMCYAFVAENLV